MASDISTIVRSCWESIRHQVRSQCAADPGVPGRRGLQLCLSFFWLIDAALQYQPFMFRPAFVTSVIQPAASGSPGFVIASVTWVSRLMLHQVAAFNAAFATVQLMIAVGLFYRRTVKLALATSILWALSVWWFGESLGGVLAGGSPLIGFPGAVILYALIAVLVWPASPSARPEGSRTSVAAAGPAGETAAKLAWLVLWGSFVQYLLLSANRAPMGIANVLSRTGGEPGWLAAAMNGMSRAASHHGLEVSVALAVLCAGVALGVWSPVFTRPALVLAVVLGLAFWIAEGLGGIFTGQGTDPNSGPLLILLAACYLPHSPRQERSKGYLTSGVDINLRSSARRSDHLPPLGAMVTIVRRSGGVGEWICWSERHSWQRSPDTRPRPEVAMAD